MSGISVPIEFLASFDKALKGLGDFSKKVEKDTNVMKSHFLAFDAALAGIGVYFAAHKIVEGFKEVIHEAAHAQVVLNGVAMAMKLAGDYSEQNVGAFEALAQQLSRTSKFDEDVILSQVKLAKQFGLTNKEAAKLITASVDLAAVTGDDLGTAVFNLGQTFDGTVGRIANKLPILQKLTAEQLKAGAAVDVIAQKYKGFAASELQTFSGALTQISKGFVEVEKAIGAPIVQSKALVDALKLISKFFEKLTDIIKTHKEEIALLAINGVLLAVKAFSLLAATLDYVTRKFDPFVAKCKLVFGMLSNEAKIAALDFNGFTGLTEVFKAYDATMAELKAKGEGPTIFNEMSTAADVLIEQIKELIKHQHGFTKEVEASAAGFDDQNTAISRSLTWLEFFKKNMTDLINTAVTAPLKGAAGARALIGSLGSLVGEKLFGPIGKALGPILEELSKGPENARKMISEFMKALPDMLENIVRAIPVAIETLYEKFPEVIDKLVADAPRIITEMIKNMPRFYASMLSGWVKVIGKWLAGAGQFIGKLLAGAGQFVVRILAGAVQFVGRILQGAGEFISRLISGIGGGSGGSLGSRAGRSGIGAAVGSIVGGPVGSVVGAIGGMFKQVRPGEQTFIGGSGGHARASGGGPSHLAINVQIGRNQFAKTLVDVKRLGYRLEPI